MINVNLELCTRVGAKETRFTCYHEMVHVVCCEFKELAKSRHVTDKQINEAGEKLAQIFAKAVLNIGDY